MAQQLNFQRELHLIGLPPPPPEANERPSVDLIPVHPTAITPDIHRRSRWEHWCHFLADRVGIYCVSCFLPPADVLAAVTCRSIRATWMPFIEIRKTLQLRVWLVFLQTTAAIPRPPPEASNLNGELEGWVAEARPKLRPMGRLVLPRNGREIPHRFIQLIVAEMPALTNLEVTGERLPNNIDLLAQRTHSIIQVNREFKELTHEQYSKIETWFHAVITHPQLKIALILFAIPICLLLFLALVIIGGTVDLLTFFQFGIASQIAGLSLFPLIGLGALWFTQRYLVDHRHPNPIRFSELPSLKTAPHRLHFAENWTINYSPTGLAFWLTLLLGLYLRNFLDSVSSVILASFAGLVLFPLAFLLEGVVLVINLLLLFLVEPLVAGIRSLLGKSLSIQR